LLRAIVAGWHRSGAAERETLLRVLYALAECPVFDLPFVSSGHTRHYVPLGGLKAGKPERTLMLDSFIALDRDREHATQAFAIFVDGLEEQLRRASRRADSSQRASRFGICGERSRRGAADKFGSTRSAARGSEIGPSIPSSGRRSVSSSRSLVRSGSVVVRILV